MVSPFPGMDPFLENPYTWSEVHHWLIAIISEKLVPQVRPKYRVKINHRIYKVNNINNNGDSSLLVGIPDVTVKTTATKQPETNQNNTSNVAILEPKTKVKSLTVQLPITEEIKQGYLEIIDLQKGNIVTAIEILSPVNKRKGEGRTKYLKKRAEILSSLTHFVEIDLLRDYEKMPILDLDIDFDYHILISQSEKRPQADLYGINLPDTLPIIPIPLNKEDGFAEINLQEILNLVYERAGYDYSIDYDQEIVPSLSDKYQNWCTEILNNFHHHQ